MSQLEAFQDEMHCCHQGHRPLGLQSSLAPGHAVPYSAVRNWPISLWWFLSDLGTLFQSSHG